MKTKTRCCLGLSPASGLWRTSLCISILFFVTVGSAIAVTNSWTKPSSGYWEEQAFWSLGVLPDATQDVLFTNPGWKALAIGTNALQRFPESMRIRSLHLGAPVDSFNTLLLNFTGFEQPLQTDNLIVESNSAVVAQGSSLEVISTSTDGSTGNLRLGGTMNHGDYSQVKVHGSLSVGAFSHGTYFFTNGSLSVGKSENIGGFGPGEFVQYGGFNNVSGLQINTEGEYDIYGGEVTATNGITVGTGDFANYASFTQFGGSVNADLVINGRYVLNDGTITGQMSVPGNTFQRVNGSVLQTGGTNFAGSMELGYPNRFGGGAIYVLSNGVVRVDSSTTFRGGWFYQYNGLHTIASNFLMRGTFVGPGYAHAEYFLGGGTLLVGELAVQATTFRQEGGSNSVAGELILNAPPPDPFGPPPQAGRYTLAGGFLSARSVILNPTDTGGFQQTGGSSRITGALIVEGGVSGSLGYMLEGGTLTVKDIQVGAGGFFQHSSGTINHSGVLILSHGDWYAATGAHALGALQLSVGAFSDSTINFPDGSSVLRLADSRAEPWASGAILYIRNWHGSTSGGGDTQLYFGVDTNGLTPQQLALVKFDLSGGVFPARILATGELVPQMQTQLSFSSSGNTLTLTWEPGWILQSSRDVTGPYQDVQGASSPYTATATNATQFFRVRQ
jgi:hypothetical protein